MKIAMSITVEKTNDGTFDVVSPSLINGKPTTYNFCSTEAIGEHVGDIIYGVFDVPAVYAGLVPAVYERLPLGPQIAVELLKTTAMRGKE